MNGIIGTLGNTIPTGQGLEKPTIKNNPIIEKAEANLAEAENELFNAQAMLENTILQRFNKLHMVKTKAEGVAHAASILDSHMRETKEGIVTMKIKLTGIADEILSRPPPPLEEFKYIMIHNRCQSSILVRSVALVINEAKTKKQADTMLTKAIEITAKNAVAFKGNQDPRTTRGYSYLEIKSKTTFFPGGCHCSGDDGSFDDSLRKLIT